MTDSPDWVVSTRNEIGELPDLPEGRAIDRTMLPLLAAGFVDAPLDVVAVFKRARLGRDQAENHQLVAFRHEPERLESEIGRAHV